jgi:hypothetical protein
MSNSRDWLILFSGKTKIVQHEVMSYETKDGLEMSGKLNFFWIWTILFKEYIESELIEENNFCMKSMRESDHPFSNLYLWSNAILHVRHDSCRAIQNCLWEFIDFLGIWLKYSESWRRRREREVRKDWNWNSKTLFRKGVNRNIRVTVFLIPIPSFILSWFYRSSSPSLSFCLWQLFFSNITFRDYFTILHRHSRFLWKSSDIFYAFSRCFISPISDTCFTKCVSSGSRKAIIFGTNHLNSIKSSWMESSIVLLRV